MFDSAAVFPPAFPALALAHFLALVSPGPDFFLIVGHGVRHRFRGSAFICLGIALGNALYIGLAVVGWSGLRSYPVFYRVLELAGGLYLAWLGLSLWRAGGKPVDLETTDSQARGPAAQLALGLASALLNPKNFIFYLTLMTVIIGPQVSFRQQLAAGIWMFLVVLLWDLALAAGLSQAGVQRFLRRRIPLVERAAGLLLLILAAGLLIGGGFQGRV